MGSREAWSVLWATGGTQIAAWPREGPGTQRPLEGGFQVRGPRPPSGPVAKLLNSAELCVLRAQGVGRKAGQARMLQPARLAALNPTRRNRPSRRLAYCRRHRRPWERGAASNGALVTRGSFPGQQCWRTGGRWQHEGNCVSGTAFAHIPWLRVCTTPGPGRTLFLYAHFTEEGFEVWEVKRLSRDPETPSTTLCSLSNSCHQSPKCPAGSSSPSKCQAPSGGRWSLPRHGLAWT